MKSFIAFLFTLLLSSAVATEMVATPPMPEQKQVETNLRSLQACFPSATLEGQCYGLGQTITIYVNTCTPTSAEWIGIFPAGIANFYAAYAWKYMCGTQQCGYPVAAGPKIITFGYDSVGSTSWPLLPGRLYQVYLMTSTRGPVASGVFQVTAGFSCGFTPPGQVPPGQSIAPAFPGSSSAPAFSSRGPTLRF